MSIKSLTASSYGSIENRRCALDRVRGELNAIVEALPTQVHPTEREIYINYILSDLNPKEDAIWRDWPSDVYLLALTAVKCLGRNPVGSETMLSSNHISTLMFHSALSSDYPTKFPTVVVQSLTSPQSREALKILANMLVLHTAGRTKFFKAAGAVAVARTLSESYTQDEEGHAEKLFLLGRLGFLVLVERAEAARQMVDNEVVDALVQVRPPIWYKTGLIKEQIFMSASVNPDSFLYLSELLKLTNALLQFYPYELVCDATTGVEAWNEKFDCPLLTQIINTLLLVPFNTRLLPTWASVPECPNFPQVNSSSGASPTMRNILTRLGNIGSPSSPRKTFAGSLAPPHSRSSAGDQRSAPNSPRGSFSSLKPGSDATSDHIALPSRLLKILDQFFDTYLPYPKRPDDDLPHGLVLDEMLPPLLLLITNAILGLESVRLWIKETLLPVSLDRSPEAGPLESREGLLGNILRLMTCAGHTQTRNAAGELMWAVCNGDASDLCVEIGYGNAAGILFQKGLTGPPPAKIEEIEESNPSQTMAQVSKSANRRPSAGSPVMTVQPATTSSPSTFTAEALRNPITGIENANQAADDLNKMTEEEKEREAERLFILFDRLEKNQVISMKSGDDQDGQKSKVQGPKEKMREKLESGEMERWDSKDAQEERQRLEEEAARDEEEAFRELAAYKRTFRK
ncbi:hypothetical protein I314_05729 [Cryptococcus bacillisporus CA1873]|uniref:Uncharacterized protein n=1 Tax=Cryptococcus bacillisporus CA1873 TaxID=1296111 RepID=A0ABR5B4H8_CRYGA|nr:hypothetical protein I314_05729 [Cryptococcus bacillisporus CA1873]|eukprot:KIR58484.1 hypothetical protein I314_05729 [Cryptococcus gattii CA1873]